MLVPNNYACQCLNDTLAKMIGLQINTQFATSSLTRRKRVNEFSFEGRGAWDV
jgi:hypothetical protein